MKLVINYDFFNAVRNVNEPLTLLKMYRNEKKRWLTTTLPVYSLLEASLELPVHHSLSWLPRNLVTCFTFLSIFTYMSEVALDDMYKYRSEKNLKNLVPQLNNLNLSTDYELLLQSKMYDKKYKVELNEKKLPSFIENKYILVPTYDTFGGVKDTSILQEHVLTSNIYTLSLGSPKKELKLAHSTI